MRQKGDSRFQCYGNRGLYDAHQHKAPGPLGLRNVHHGLFARRYARASGKAFVVKVTSLTSQEGCPRFVTTNFDDDVPLLTAAALGRRAEIESAGSRAYGGDGGGPGWAY